jgi:uncharacterized protein (DUF924 family)
MPRHRNVESQGGDGWLCSGEDPVDQQRSVELFRDLATEVPEEWTKLFDSYLDFAVRHKEIIDRFGRFPHRNAILGRESMAAEIEFLEQPGSGF